MLFSAGVTTEHFCQMMAKRILQPRSRRSQRRREVSLYPHAYPLSIILRTERYQVRARCACWGDRRDCKHMCGACVRARMHDNFNLTELCSLIALRCPDPFLPSRSRGSCWTLHQ